MEGAINLEFIVVLLVCFCKDNKVFSLSLPFGKGFRDGIKNEARVISSGFFHQSKNEQLFCNCLLLLFSRKTNPEPTLILVAERSRSYPK